MKPRIAIAVAAAAMLVAVGRPAAQAQAVGGALHLLDVPYLPQSEALCGGAAVAMVMRFWGAEGVYADTFADLVDRNAGGIRGDELLRALRARGWTATSYRGDEALIQSQLAERHPVIALIEDRPGRYHYVVVVGWNTGRVIVHDPARAPFRILQQDSFVAAWSQTGFWTMVATPPARSAGSRSADEERVEPPSGPAPCDGMVDEGVRLAGRHDIAGARQLFEMAAISCPASSAPWRELAGLHALAADWKHAAADAERAVEKNGGDVHAWRILATGRYLEGDLHGALEAWNRSGEPLIDLIAVEGLERTRYDVVTRILGLQPRTVLTGAALDRAARRLAELPAAAATRVTFRPEADGRGVVAAAVIERPRVPWGVVPLGTMAVSMLSDRELRGSIASPSGGGELWTASWRWWEHRPRAGLAFSAPSPSGASWGVEFDDERQTYASPRAPIEERRRTASFHVSDWLGAGLRWQATAGIDRWTALGRSVALGGSLQQRLAADRAVVEARAGFWAGGVRAWTLATRAEWRSTSRHDGHVLLARAGADTAGAGAPLALWSGAGTGQGREALLRAHPLLADGIITRGVFGRTLAYGSAEWQRWWHSPMRPLGVAPALFLDIARAWSRPDGFDRDHADLGAGLRIAVPGSGVLRLDFARGLDDRRTAFSIGWTK
ncbi:MAG: hypothetical protein A3H96_14040 [Acidobacteria bacterium RIFCSPLOWO2_02_FULL_67_36]|nr:MAG: hypothetical protein A3H96_14040 [Acidobacteria bacterium RIFCSPLOWO2_02_FULL_67_36]